MGLNSFRAEGCRGEESIQSRPASNPQLLVSAAALCQRVYPIPTCKQSATTLARHDDAAPSLSNPDLQAIRNYIVVQVLNVNESIQSRPASNPQQTGIDPSPARGVYPIPTCKQSATQRDRCRASPPSLSNPDLQAIRNEVKEGVRVPERVYPIPTCKQSATERLRRSVADGPRRRNDTGRHDPAVFGCLISGGGDLHSRDGQDAYAIGPRDAIPRLWVFDPSAGDRSNRGRGGRRDVVELTQLGADLHQDQA